eukprot:3707756-Pleurochrysis_carterae.AAC.1
MYNVLLIKGIWLLAFAELIADDCFSALRCCTPYPALLAVLFKRKQAGSHMYVRVSYNKLAACLITTVNAWES